MTREISKRETAELAEAGGGIPRLISSAGEDAVSCHQTRKTGS